MMETHAASCDGVVISAAGGPDVLRWRQGLPLPALGQDELLVRVAYAGVNRHDCSQRRRGPTLAHSDVPGLEVSGFVCATGSRVTQFQVGDEVCALVDGGGYATHAIASADVHCFAQLLWCCIPGPENRCLSTAARAAWGASLSSCCELWGIPSMSPAAATTRRRRHCSLVPGSPSTIVRKTSSKRSFAQRRAEGLT